VTTEQKWSWSSVDEPNVWSTPRPLAALLMDMQIARAAGTVTRVETDREVILTTLLALFSPADILTRASARAPASLCLIAENALTVGSFGREELGKAVAKWARAHLVLPLWIPVGPEAHLNAAGVEKRWVVEDMEKGEWYVLHRFTTEKKADDFAFARHGRHKTHPYRVRQLPAVLPEDVHEET